MARIHGLNLMFLEGTLKLKWLDEGCLHQTYNAPGRVPCAVALKRLQRRPTKISSTY